MATRPVGRRHADAWAWLNMCCCLPSRLLMRMCPAVLFSILDHHNIFAETIEAMQHPRK